MEEGQGIGIGQIPLAVLVVAQHGQRDHLAPLLGAQEVDADVGGQPVKPGGELGGELERVQAAPCPHKGVLGKILGVGFVVYHAQGQMIDLLLIALHQRFECSRIAGGCLLNQSLVVQFVTSNRA